MMRSKILTRRLTAIAGLYLLGVGTEARSPDTSAVQRLRETRECAGCNLSNADLKGATLSGIKLSTNSNLCGTIMPDGSQRLC